MSQTSETAAVARATMVRATVAGTIGNVLEWYDFTVYAYLAPSIGAAFFPSASGVAQILFAFGVFGVGFFMRPVGSIVIGAYGDRAGRRAALTLTVGADGRRHPGYRLAAHLRHRRPLGAAAAHLVRLLAQGFSGGGEWGGAATFLVEFAPPAGAAISAAISRQRRRRPAVGSAS